MSTFTHYFGKFCLALIFGLAFSLPNILVAQTYVVDILGEVEFNQITTGELGDVSAGESVAMSLLLDAMDFADSSNFPTRGYPILNDAFSLNLFFENGNSVSLQNPFPAGSTPFFVIRNDDPAVDGFFISTSVDNPFGVPLNQTGQFGQFSNDFMVTYTGDVLSSLSIEDAEGSYDFTGLSAFNWTINDGPFNAMGIEFNLMVISEVAIDSCGFPRGDVNNDGDVNLLDVEPFVQAILNSKFSCEADINCDGVVDLLDVAPFVLILIGG